MKLTTNKDFQALEIGQNIEVAYKDILGIEKAIPATVSRKSSNSVYAKNAKGYEFRLSESRHTFVKVLPTVLTNEEVFSRLRAPKGLIVLYAKAQYPEFKWRVDRFIYESMRGINRKHTDYMKAPFSNDAFVKVLFDFCTQKEADAKS